MDPRMIFSVIAAASLLVGGVGLYRMGYKSGVAVVKVSWEQQLREQQQIHLSALENLMERERVAQAAAREISSELAELAKKHEMDLRDLRYTHERRLQISAERAAYYRNQAEAGADECRGLASHAAELDRALEEGRALVRELGETLGLRDEQLHVLRRQLEADRAQLNSLKDDSDGR